MDTMVLATDPTGSGHPDASGSDRVTQVPAHAATSMETPSRLQEEAFAPVMAAPTTRQGANPHRREGQGRSIAPVPRIAIQAFCESHRLRAVLESAAADRLMGRAGMTARDGGIEAAVESYRQDSTPDLVIVENRLPNEAFLAQLDRLADVCDAGTKVLVIGHTNDIGFYRALLNRGVSDYVLAPVEPQDLVAAISGIYRGGGSEKIGKVYAFVGAKGGVGSSTMAHNIAWTMARRLGSDVVLADMDLPFGTGSLDFNLDAVQGIAEAVQDAGRLDDVMFDRLLTKVDEHLSLLAAPTLLDRAYDFDEATFAPLLDIAQANVPFTVLDVPHCWTGWARQALIAADDIVVTAVPDLANLRNAKSLLAFLKQARPSDPPPKLILNQVGLAKRPEIKPRDFAQALELESIACIPFDAHLFGTAANNGQMLAQLSTKTSAAHAFADIVEKMTGRREQKIRSRTGRSIGAMLERVRCKSRNGGAQAR